MCENISGEPLITDIDSPLNSKCPLWIQTSAAKRSQSVVLVAQCSATPATVPATPPCCATPFQTQISVQQTSREWEGERCDTKTFRGCSATPVLHLQNAIKSRKSAATRVARHVWRDRGYPQSCATKSVVILATTARKRSCPLLPDPSHVVTPVPPQQGDQMWSDSAT